MNRELAKQVEQELAKQVEQKASYDCLRRVVEYFEDDIVVESLKMDFNGNVESLRPDLELLKSIERVLEYYMLPDEYDEWTRERSKHYEISGKF